MQRPKPAQLAYGSATVVLSAVALLLLSGTTTILGITAICVACLMLGVLVAVTMPVRARHVKTPDTSSGTAVVSIGEAPGDEAIRVPAAPVGAGADTRIAS
ncbi:hypothetical protein [Streptomyces sp. NPDC090025]|uniref:hypothetical protein n=1 Tax=Streptomyces sp. NPDC090025 TaxID=3365922 RepID=UPI003835148A